MITSACAPLVNAVPSNAAPASIINVLLILHSLV
jgi:hypothetical protein